jgi:two-component sensor histidine kinase
VLSERRMRALRNLSNATLEAATEAETVEQACKRLLALLCSDNPDVPFGVQYLTNEPGRAHLIASINVDAAIFPPSIPGADHDPRGIGRVLRDRKALVIDHSTALSPPLPGGAWPEPTTQFVALPMTVGSRDTNLIGVLVVGVNSRLRLDESYLDFLNLVATQLAGSVSAMQSIEEEMRTAKVKEDLINELQLAKEALEAQVEQKELLLKEVNHRVKNSLQIVSSILQLQVPYVAGTEAAGAMRNAAARVLAVATVHERLYRGENVKTVQLDTFLGDLCHEIGRACGCPEGIEASVDKIEVPTDMAVPLALIVNELVTNVIKHVGPPCGIALRANSGESLKLTISDQGQGPAQERTGQGLGSRIVKAFSDQLGATVETKREPTGHAIELMVPLAAS